MKDKAMPGGQKVSFTAIHKNDTFPFHTYALADDPRKLQNRIDIVGHYPRRYRLVFSVDKTKVTVTGSKHDVNYYKDVPIWFLNKEQIKVNETNEHLWLIVSGENAKFHQQFRFLEYKLQDGTKIRCVRSPYKTNSDGADH